MLKEKIKKTNQANDLKIAIKIIRVKLYKKKKMLEDEIKFL